MARLKTTLINIIMRDQMMLTRLILSLGSLTWAAMLLLPSELFNPGRTTYRIMAEIAPEWAWGTAFLIHGVFSMSTLTHNTRNRVTLTLDGLLGCILWTSSTAACFAAHWPAQYPTFYEQLINFPPPAAMSGEFWVSVASWWHLVRHWAEEENEPTCKC